jgi:hypothetical protein
MDGAISVESVVRSNSFDEKSLKPFSTNTQGLNFAGTGYEYG